MKLEIEKYLHLAKLFLKHNFHLYLVGGCVRDMLLSKEVSDLDLTTDATPEEIASFISDVDLSFAKYGSIRLFYEGIKVELTTLRIEKGYKDFRHPDKIIFTRELKKDCLRRDFTINGLYMDDHFHVYDYVGGEKDISNKLIRTIGKPSTRFKEDPLRILRAIRFSLKLNFEIENKTSKAMMKYSKLVEKLHIEKINEEIRKMGSEDIDRKKSLFEQYGLSQYIKDMVE